MSWRRGHQDFPKAFHPEIINFIQVQSPKLSFFEHQNQQNIEKAKLFTAKFFNRNPSCSSEKGIEFVFLSLSYDQIYLLMDINKEKEKL